MILKQYYLGCLAHASYLIADEKAGVAAIVDPQRDIDQYLRDAREAGVAIRWALLTHFHADFVAGHLELRERAGAAIGLGAKASADYPFERLEEGRPLRIGDVRLEFLETPGHTPEGISILVHDGAAATRPHAVLTGDTLFIGDVGRPDLMASVGISAQELAGMLYRSLHGKLMKLPDETLVYPAHGAGSMCGRNMSQETVSTIGEQRRYNHALQPMSEEEFIAMVTADQPEAPSYFGFDADLNRRERPTLDAALEKALKALPLEEVLTRRDGGAQVVDTRDPADFAGAHLDGAVNIGLDGKYATWAGTVLSHERPILIVAAAGREVESAMRLGRIGFDHVEGYLEGGMQALEARPDLVRRVDRITAAALAERLQAGDAPAVVDVRAPGEHAAEAIEGSVNIPLPQIVSRIDEIPSDRPVVIHCASGYRSSIAASLLQQHGLRNISDLVGGYAAWEARQT